MNLPVPKTTFLKFLCDAKRATYAAGQSEGKVKAALPGSTQLEFRQGGLLYRDVFFGGSYFAGLETVYYLRRPFWAMTYAGGVVQEKMPIDTDELYSLLKTALSAVPSEAPFRGPSTLKQGVLTYTNRILGDFQRFSGSEAISIRDVQVYHLNYSGGLLA